jgi:hypothetical protein
VDLLALGIVQGGVTLRGHRHLHPAQIADFLTEVRRSPFGLHQVPA